MPATPDTIYDLLIIGGGPAGLSAAIYAARYRLKFAVLAASYEHPQLTSHRVANYPALPDTTGGDLWEKMRLQAIDLGAELLTTSVSAIAPVALAAPNSSAPLFTLTTDSARTYQARALILATGAAKNQLGLPHEDRLVGHGISYCATCDAAFFCGQAVAVVGGGNSALSAALHLAEFATRVYLIHRRAELSGDPALIEKIHAHSKITVILNTAVAALAGTDSLESVTLDQPYQDSAELPVTGLFIEIGATPETSFLADLDLKFDPRNKIVIDSAQKTNLPGVWAAGDLTTGSNGLKQIITACAEGAIAAADVFTALKLKS